MPVVLGGMGVVLTGLLALLLIVAAWLLLEIVIRMLDAVMKSNLFSRFLHRAGEASRAAVDASISWMVPAAMAVINFFLAAPRAIELLINSIEDALWAHTWWLRALAYDVIPRFREWISAWVNGLRGFLLQTIWDAYLTAVNYVNAVRASLLSFVQQRIAQVFDYARLVYEALVRALGASIDAVRSFAWSLYVDALRLLNLWVNRLVKSIADLGASLMAFAVRMAEWAVQTAFGAATEWARRYVDQLLGLFERVLVAGCAAVLAPVYPRILDIIDALAKAWPGSLAGLLPRIGVIPRSLPLSLAGLLSLIAAIGAISLDWIRECGIPLCKRLGSLGWALDGMQDELLILDLMDLVESAVRDPGSSSRDVAGVLSGEVSAVADGVFESIGLR